MSTVYYSSGDTVHVRIEQAIARAGEYPVSSATVVRICERLEVSVNAVMRAIRRMDVAAGHEPEPDTDEDDADDEPIGVTVKPCGTRAAYIRHKRAGETPCQPCVAASREYHRQQTAAQDRRRAA